jgi:septal ring factor EnvC (AmiA/AmiB activator)
MTLDRNQSPARRSRVLTLLGIACALLVPPVALGQSRGVGADVEIASVLDSIETTTAEKERLESELSSIGTRRETLKAGVRRETRALYRLHRAGVPLAGGVDAVLRHVARVERLRRLLRRELEAHQKLDSETTRLRAQAVESSRTLEQARARLASLQSVSAQPSSAARGPVLQPAPDGYRAPDQGGYYGLRLVDPIEAESFVSQRGKLASPIRGDVRLRPGRREESDGPGLEIEAPIGTPVRAVAAGRVAFSDRYGSYGRLVILDHGDGYYTVYGGLGAVEVRVGDDLSREARIGNVGSDFSPASLFFEVRKGTRTLEPRAWLGF